MQYSPRAKLPAQQLNWAQIWLSNLIGYNNWSLINSIPTGYYVYLYIDEE